MRKVVVSEFMSLDGVAERPNEFMTQWDPEMDASGDAVIANQDTVILGRRTYDEWVGFWPTSDIQPFADFINGATKYVATSEPLAAAWANATAIEGDLVEFVRGLKARDGADIGITGSLSVAQTLLAAGLVDELKLLIVPIIVGGERRLFDGLSSINLELTRSVTSQTGHLILDYRVIR